MGYFKDIHYDLLDLYSRAESNYLMFSKDIYVDGQYSKANAVSAAQFYGMMVGYSNAEKTIFHSDVIEQQMKELGEIKLYEYNYKDES